MTIKTEEQILFEHNGWFQGVFLDELDSWFSADIACCESCYDDFLQMWPHAYSADDAQFQKHSIDLELMYSGTRLRDLYSKQEYDVLVTTLRCPRCGSEIKGWIWPYEFPFHVDYDLEMEIERIAEIASQTPFLILENELAKNVHTTIKHLGESAPYVKLEAPLYRARTYSKENDYGTQQFDLPPKSKVAEGRYNHAGSPVFYTADDIKTCFHELRERECVAVEITTTQPVKLLDLTIPYSAAGADHDVLNAIVYSSLMSAKHTDAGWHKPAYVFSRFVADCARSAGYDAIKYPSTRTAEGCYNIVFLSREWKLKNRWSIIDCFIWNGDRKLTYPEEEN